MTVLQLLNEMGVTRDYDVYLQSLIRESASDAELCKENSLKKEISTLTEALEVLKLKQSRLSMV